MEKTNSTKPLLDKEINNIFKKNDQLLIKFKDGSEIPLISPQGEILINVPYCNFCGDPGDDNHPLFTIDNKTFICSNCVSLAVKTFLENDIDIAIELGEKFKDCGKQLTLFDEAFKTNI